MSFIDGPVHDLGDFQVEYDGLLLGPDTPYGLPPAWEFLNLGPVKTLDTARVWADGSFSGPDFADVLTPTLPVEISATGEDDFALAVQDLRRVMGVRAAPAPLWFKLPGFTVEGIGAKVAGRTIPVDLTWGALSVGQLQWRIPSNPVWQTPTRQIVLLATQPVLAGAWVGNDGNTDCWPAAVVTGPCAGFTLTVNGAQIAYGANIPASGQVTLDFETGLATSVTPGDVTGSLTSRQWSPIPAGQTVPVTFTASGGQCVLTVADLWR